MRGEASCISIFYDSASGERCFGDYWKEYPTELFISTKELLALVHAMRDAIQNCRVDANIDSKAVITPGKVKGVTIDLCDSCSLRCLLAIFS